MRRPPWNDKTADLPPLERELHELREENRRLKGLMELREDRTELERYQIQSRNKLLGMFGVFLCVLALGGVLFAMQRVSYVNQLKQDSELILKLKKGVQYLQTNSDSQGTD